MLARLETAYLATLRVVVLVAATLALVVAGFALVSAIPPLLRWTGILEAGKPSGGTLQDFISEQRIPDAVSGSAQTTPVEPFAYDDIKSAANTVREYLGKRGTATRADWQRGLQQDAESLAGHELEYAAAVRGMAEQLAQSKGKPLTQARVAQLFVWLKTRFEGDVLARSAREAEANRSFWTTIGAAGASFLGFMMIVFIFIFVKIERSLRLVQTMRVTQGE